MDPHRIQPGLFDAIPFNTMNDPGPNHGPIYIDRQFAILPFNIVDNEARTIAQPDRPGVLCFVELRNSPSSKSLTLTVQGTYDNTNSTLTFAQATVKPWALLVSVITAAGGGAVGPNADTCQWRVLFAPGVTGTGITIPTQTQTALTDNSGGSASTTLASISDTPTKNAVASLAAELALVKADVAAILAYLAK